MSDATQYYGGSAVVVKGTGCFAIASDTRLGESYHSTSDDVSKIAVLTPYAAIAIIGFRPDSQKIIDDLKYELKMFELIERRIMSPTIFMNYVSRYLYSFRTKGNLLVQCVVGTIDPTSGDVSVFAVDSVGSISEAKKGVAIGGAATDLMTMLEAMWQDGKSLNLEQETKKIEEIATQVMVDGVENHIFSGFNAEIRI